MTGVVKATEPTRRMGVYKRLGDVPDRYRLAQHAAAYEGRDVWSEWVDALEAAENLTDYRRERLDRAGRRWVGHVSDRGRHHALARPEDVETWCVGLLDAVAIRTAYENYWAQLEAFYRWLQFHTDHPHVYHPVLMAAEAGGAAGELWAHKIERGRERAREREANGRR